MALFFESKQSVTDRVLSQGVLSDWRKVAIPAVYSIVAVPIGVPFTVTYKRRGKAFEPEDIEYEKTILAPSGKTIQDLLTKPDWKALSKFEFPKLSSAGYAFIDEFKMKGVLTCAASRVRTSESEVTSYKKCDFYEVLTRKLPPLRAFVEQLLQRPTVYVYDVDQPLLSPMHPLLDVQVMGTGTGLMTARHDMHGLLYARMDMVSAFGFQQWAEKYKPHKRLGHYVILTSEGGKNLWLHNKYVVCMSANNDRAAKLALEA